MLSDEQDSSKDNQISRREFVKLVGVGSLFFGLGALGISNVLNNIRKASAQGANATNATGASAAPPGNNSGIRPFQVNVPEAELTELRRRINATKWPERETVTDASQGVQLAVMPALARPSAPDYNGRTREAELNALPQFISEIDGLDIHFIHVRSKHVNALPLVVTHGWPGSILEQLKIVDPLVNPTAFGGSASDAF